MNVGSRRRSRQLSATASRVGLAIVVACGLLASTVVADVADVADAATTPVYSPKPGLTFNNPEGTKAQQFRINSEIDRALDAAPKGANVYMAQYLFDIDSTANKMIAAYKRGVNVKVLIDDGNVTPQSKRVKQVLGSDKTKPSYVTTCSHSCMSNSASVMHAKFYLFSAAGSSRLVSMISSANPYKGNIIDSWNNNHTVVGDAKIYNSLVQYFNDMIKDKNNANYYRTTTSGKYKLYFFPRAAKAGVNPAIMVDVLNHVSCTGVAKGYGSNGRTVIRVAMWGWSAARLDIARKLWELHNRGCKVEVIANSGRTGTRVAKALLKPSSRYGVMPIYDAWRDKNRNDLAELYMHHKTVAINGKWFGHPNTRVTYTGSQNFTGPATLANNDIVVRIVDNATYNAYAKNLNYIRTRYTKRMTTVPPPPVIPPGDAVEARRIGVDPLDYVFED